MTKLFYVHDPMCSWCWGFNKSWNIIKKTLPESIEIVHLLGGLAKDSQSPMPLEMRNNIATIWHQVASVSGAEFNHDFWVKNTPKRSTYPACRAVIVAASLDKEHAMIQAIRHAYYLNAQNPSESEVLVACAESIGIDGALFSQKLNAPETQEILTEQIRFARSIGGDHFPSLFLQKEESNVQAIQIDYRHPELVIDRIISAKTH